MKSSLDRTVPAVVPFAARSEPNLLRRDFLVRAGVATISTVLSS